MGKGLMLNKDNEIWQLIDSRNFGGIESHILQLCIGLQNSGYKPRVIFINDYGEHPMIAQLQQYGVNYSIWKKSYINAITDLILSPQKPQLMHSHGYKAGIISRFITTFVNLPLVSSFHSGESKSGKLKLYDFIDRYSACLSDCRLAVSQQISQSLPYQNEIINNFVNTQSTGLSKGEKIAFVGRISKEKGIEDLRKIAQLMPHKEFHCYGDGPLIHLLKQQKNIILHGQQPSMDAIWPQIGLLLMPSHFEGLPMAAIESMARGIPVLASAVGDLPQLIQHGQNGWLRETADIDAFVLTIKIWLSISINQRQTIALAAQKTIQEHYSLSAVLPQVLQRYDTLTA